MMSGYENHVGIVNPFRYRSYYFDQFTRLYYLQSRYYDIETKRFISADSINNLTPEKLNGFNLYAYCLNNPVNMIDSTGTSPKWWQWALFGIGAALVIAAAVVLTVITYGAAAAPAGMLGAMVLGAAKGALIGAAVGAAAGIAAGAIYAGVTGADMGDSILQGFLTGFGGGAIIGAVIGGAIGAMSYTPSGLNRGAINQAVRKTLRNPNKMHHILKNPSHNLTNYTTRAAGQLMKKTLVNGTVTAYKTVSSVVWTVMNSQVTYTIIGGVIMIGDMWLF